MGVGAVVRAGQATRGRHVHRPQGGTGGERRGEGDAGRAPSHEDDERQQQRPQHIELLLDGERPEVSEELRFGRAEV